jgi:prolipoprotein diacylglyceryltransferase
MLFVRLGNFFNSEIVGSETTVAWGMRFMRYDSGSVARHPVQLYEALLSLALLIALIALDRKLGKEARPTGLLAGVFFAGYFSGRLLLETVKEHEDVNALMYGLTMAQWLSLPFLGFGVWLIVRALRAQGRVESEDSGSV